MPSCNNIEVFLTSFIIQAPVKHGDARFDYRFDVLVFQNTNIANKDEELSMKYKVQD